MFTNLSAGDHSCEMWIMLPRGDRGPELGATFATDEEYGPSWPVDDPQPNTGKSKQPEMPDGGTTVTFINDNIEWKLRELVLQEFLLNQCPKHPANKPKDESPKPDQPVLPTPENKPPNNSSKPLANQFSGYDNTVSGIWKLIDAIFGMQAPGILKIAETLGSFSAALWLGGIAGSISEFCTGLVEIINAASKYRKAVSDMEATKEQYDTYQRLRDNPPTADDASGSHASASTTSDSQRSEETMSQAAWDAITRDAIKHGKAAKEKEAATLVLCEKSSRITRDSLCGAANVILAIWKAVDWFSSAATRVLDVAGKVVPTVTGLGLKLAGGIVGIVSGAFHLIQSIPEMIRWKKTMNEQAATYKRLKMLSGKGSADSNDPIAALKQRCTTENKRQLNIAKAEFAKSIIRCIFGSGSIVIGILSLVFPPVAIGALIFGAIYGIYTGIHIMTMKAIAAKQERTLKAEADEIASKPGQDLKENSTWLLHQLYDHLKAAESDESSRTREIDELLTAAGLDRQAIQTLRNKARAVDATESENPVAARDEFTKTLRGYLYEGKALDNLPTVAASEQARAENTERKEQPA
jgi:hypothetical protein